MTRSGSTARMDRLPFTLPDDGLRELTGFVHLDREFLVIDLRSALAGILGKERDVIKVAPTALAEVCFRPGIFRDQIRLRPHEFGLLDAVPGRHDRELALRLKRRYRDEAQRMAEELDARVRARP